VAKDGDEDRESDRGFRGRDNDREKDDDLARVAADFLSIAGEREVRAVQHQLDRKKDRDGVAPQKRAGEPERKERGRDDEDVRQRDVHFSPRRMRR
jgi:hypothetical protein